MIYTKKDWEVWIRNRRLSIDWGRYGQNTECDKIELKEKVYFSKGEILTKEYYYEILQYFFFILFFSCLIHLC